MEYTKAIVAVRQTYIIQRAVVPQNSPYSLKTHILIRYRMFAQAYPRWTIDDRWQVDLYDPTSITSFFNALSYPTFYNPSHPYLYAAPRMKTTEITKTLLTLGTRGPVVARGGHQAFTREEVELANGVLESARQIQALLVAQPPPVPSVAHDVGHCPYPPDALTKALNDNFPTLAEAEKARDSLYVQVTSLLLWIRALGAESFNIREWDRAWDDALRPVTAKKNHPYAQLIKREREYHRSFMGTVFSLLSPVDKSNRLVRDTKMVCWDIARWSWKDLNRGSIPWWKEKYKRREQYTFLTNPPPDGSSFAWATGDAVIMDDEDPQAESADGDKVSATELGWSPCFGFDSTMFEGRQGIKKPKNLVRRQKAEAINGNTLQDLMSDRKEVAFAVMRPHDNRGQETHPDSARFFNRPFFATTSSSATAPPPEPSRPPSPDSTNIPSAPPPSVPVVRGYTKTPMDLGSEQGPPTLNDGDWPPLPSGSGQRGWGNSSPGATGWGASSESASAWERIRVPPGEKWNVEPRVGPDPRLPPHIYQGPDEDRRKDSFWHGGYKEPLRRRGAPRRPGLSPPRPASPSLEPTPSMTNEDSTTREPSPYVNPYLVEPSSPPPPPPAIIPMNHQAPSASTFSREPDSVMRSPSPASPPRPAAPMPPRKDKGKGKARETTPSEAPPSTTEPSRRSRSPGPPLQRILRRNEDGTIDDTYGVHVDDALQPEHAGSSRDPPRPTNQERPPPVVRLPTSQVPRTPTGPSNARRPTAGELLRDRITDSSTDAGERLLARMRDGPVLGMRRRDRSTHLPYPRSSPRQRPRELSLLRRIYPDGVPLDLGTPGASLLERMESRPDPATAPAVSALGLTGGLPPGPSAVVGPEPTTTQGTTEGGVNALDAPEEGEIPTLTLGSRRFFSVPERFWREMFLLSDDVEWIAYLRRQRSLHQDPTLNFKDGSTLKLIYRQRARYAPKWRSLATSWLSNLYQRPGSDYDEPLLVPWDEPLSTIVGSTAEASSVVGAPLASNVDVTMEPGPDAGEVEGLNLPSSTVDNTMDIEQEYGTQEEGETQLDMPVDWQGLGLEPLILTEDDDMESGVSEGGAHYYTHGGL